MNETFATLRCTTFFDFLRKWQCVKIALIIELMIFVNREKQQRVVKADELVTLERCNHFKHRNVYFELLFSMKVFHGVVPFHFSHISFQIAATHILVLIAGKNNRLHTYNPISI